MQVYAWACLFCLSALENTDSDIGLCGWILVLFSILLTLLTLPLSIWMCIKVLSGGPLISVMSYGLWSSPKQGLPTRNHSLFCICINFFCKMCK